MKNRTLALLMVLAIASLTLVGNLSNLSRLELQPRAWEATDDILIINDSDGNKIFAIGSTLKSGLNMSDVWMGPAASGTDLTAPYAMPFATAAAHVATISAQPDFPRNLIVRISSNVGAGGVTGSIVIVGTNSIGVLTTETLVASNTVTGNVAWSFVDSVTVLISTYTNAVNEAQGGTNTTPSINIDEGDKMGLSNDIYLAKDVYAVRDADVLIAESGVTINATYNTYVPATAANGTREYQIWYKTRFNW